MPQNFKQIRKIGTIGAAGALILSSAGKLVGSKPSLKGWGLPLLSISVGLAALNYAMAENETAF